ncbi:MAG TPA: aromatic ring-hydroxylating dioxygenase subunit alpha [Solirubrobacteraceae bacterium]|jgi:Rieske 2Fe-2S family protein|nr:aromatic ring-hydroxylating dioxygenase subunit alpha [Solirubrobacteraceae bacterium]
MATFSEADRLLPTLDRHWYVDPAIFAAEQERIFARRWILAGRGSDVPAPGDYVTVEIAGESVIVMRTADGGLSAMLNICRHRGARILLEERGSCGRTIRCPYHAWSYSPDGELVGAPNLRDWVGDSRHELSLQRLSVRERYGCVWVNLDPGAASSEDDVEVQIAARLGAADRIDAWELDRLRTGRSIVYEIAANWKLIVENFMECYHCTTIHPELVAVIPEFRSGIASQAGGSGYGSAIGDKVDGFTVDGRAGLEPLPLVPEDDRRRYFGMTIVPGAFINLLGDHVIVHRLIPKAVDHTTLVCEWLFPPETLDSGADIEPTVELFDRVNQQDFDACERCQLGAASRAYAHENVLVPLEHHLLGFYDQVRAAVEA